MRDFWQFADAGPSGVFRTSTTLSKRETRACNELALRTLDWKQGEFAEGLRCYRSRKFFAAHEHWESVWLVAKGPPKIFLQVLIQLAAVTKRGALSLMQTALHRLEPHPVSFGGIAVASLCEEICEWQKKLKTGDAPLDFAPPRIRVC